MLGFEKLAGGAVGAAVKASRFGPVLSADHPAAAVAEQYVLAIAPGSSAMNRGRRGAGVARVGEPDEFAALGLAATAGPTSGRPTPMDEAPVARHRGAGPGRDGG